MSPGSMTGWGAPSGSPVPELQEDHPSLKEADDHKDYKDHNDEEDQKDDKQHDEEAAAHQAESPQAGPTTVTLPDGDTVTAPSPQVAAAIEAAAGGTPIADAFHQQGITIPAPGTAVTNPIDPVRVTPGDIGIFTDRHALGLGHGKALLDGQIQQIGTVTGPSFLGWEHPPAAATATVFCKLARNADVTTSTQKAAEPRCGNACGAMSSMRRAVEAWIATKPRTNPNAPSTPFAMPVYRVAANAEVERQRALAAASFAKAQEAEEQADQYVRLTVIFAAVSFLAGISTKFVFPNHIIVVVVGFLTLIFGFVRIFGLPVL